MRVLIVKTSSMGDVLHTLPALTDAAQAIPGIRFDWVVEEGFAQIPSWHESVERVIPVAIRRWRKAWFSAPIKAERQAFRETVQAVKYDAIILAVAHKEFLNIDLKKHLNENGVIYDVKGILDRNIIDGRL